MTKYYLDTNAIYDLKKYPTPQLPFSYTSAFTVLELTTGIKDESTYNYRKWALKHLV